MGNTLGPFEVDSFIASGGMGDVYLGHHRSESHPAAIKVVRAGRLLGSPDAFLREVRAAASLNHPSIVAVYDYGEVTDAESRAADGKYTSGTHWLAMEFATDGTLEDIDEVRSWGVLRRILTEILDALAHAHARGLVHRDLKPGNVLVTRRSEAVSLLLADFGIAHLLNPSGTLPERTEDIDGLTAGTPLYMAPEQIRAQWRDLGPWTDLYALGCLGWELATGEPPFQGDSAVEVAVGHLQRPLPTFRPRFEAPQELEQWFGKLLQKSPLQRPQRAADAAWSLLQIPGAEHDDATLREHLLSSSPSLGTLGRVEEAETTRLPSVPVRALQAADDRGTQLFIPSARPPVPPDWRPVQEPASGVSRGLGVFGLREIPMVGREQTRDLLWRGLRRAAAGDSAVLVVDGANGSGKSTLLRWLGVRAHEVGVATVLRANHTAMLGPSAGLASMLARWLGCGGLDREAVFRRLGEMFEGLGRGDDTREEAAVLTQIIAPREADDGDDVPVVMFNSPTERYSVIERFLRSAAKRRPLLLLVDDAQWGADALGFAHHLQVSLDEEPCQIFVVIGVDAARVEGQPLSAGRLAQLLQHPHVHRHVLTPTDTSTHLALVSEFIGLTEALADTLVGASRGSTAYSLCVVSDWVRRGILRPSPQGYGFVEGADAALPKDLFEAWDARLDRLAATFAIPHRMSESLEIAAALGDDVGREEWRSVCTLRGVSTPTGLGHLLVDEGIMRATERGFAFVYSATVQALQRRAVAGGRWARIHADCGTTIQRGAQNGSCVAERRGQHFLRAGMLRQALLEIATAVESRLARSAYDEAIALCDQYLGAASDPRAEPTLVIRARRAQALRYQSQTVAAEREANAILEISAETGSELGRGEGLRVLAGLENVRGNAGAGVAQFTAAMEAYERAGHQMGVAKCAHGRGWLLLQLNAFQEALADFSRGIELATALDEPLDVAWGQQGLAEAALYSNELTIAEDAASNALEQFRALGSRAGEGMALTSIANVYRDRGQPDDARALYRNAIDLLSSFDSALVSFPRLQLIAFELRNGSLDSTADAIDRMKDASAPLPFRIVAAVAALWVNASEGFGDALSELQSLMELNEGPVHPLFERTWHDVESRLTPSQARQAHPLVSSAL